MTTEAFLQTAVTSIWKMTRHTVCCLCDRYRPTNDERICRPCMERHVRHYYEFADNEENTDGDAPLEHDEPHADTLRNRVDRGDP